MTADEGEYAEFLAKEGKQAQILFNHCRGLLDAEVRWSTPEFEPIRPDGISEAFLMTSDHQGAVALMPCGWGQGDWLMDYCFGE